MRRTEMAGETWLLGGEPVSDCDRSSGSIKTSAEPSASTARIDTTGATFTFTIPDSGLMNSERWFRQPELSLWEDFWWCW